MASQAETNGDSTSNSNGISSMWLKHAVLGVVLLQAMFRICVEAYAIRMYAVNEFGRVIHEFDPYFNYRATEVSVCV